MAVQAVNSAGTGTATTATATKSTTMIDKNAFLNLLVSQLKYQDPMDPMKADQFMSQLAQMTQVEQLQNISDSLQTMSKASSAANPSQWVSTIGKKISVDSTLLSKGDQVYLTPSGDYDKVLLTLKKADGSTAEVTFKKGDSLAYTHDGSDVVSFSVNATKSGQQVAVTASPFQIVRGVQVDSSGALTLASGTGESYTIAKVKQIIQ
jgi:flagellar basal-body rod modification protein FlgD